LTLRLTAVGKYEAALWSVREFELKSLRHEPKASAALYATRSFKELQPLGIQKGIEGEAF